MCILRAANACSRRKEIDSCTRRDTTSCQSPEIRRLVNHQLCRFEESVPWSSTRTDCEAENLPQSPQYAPKNAWRRQCNTFLERFQTAFLYWESLTNVSWDESVMTHDDIAREDHSYNATREESSRNERSWRLALNAEGAQGPLDQRDDYKQAKETSNKMYESMQQQQDTEKRTNSSTTTSPTSPTSSLKVTKTIRIDLIHLGGGIMFPRQFSFSSSSSWRQKSDSWRASGQLHHGVKRDFLSFQMIHVGCRKFNLRAIDGEV